jgi:hypothetical protein
MQIESVAFGLMLWVLIFIGLREVIAWLPELIRQITK